MAKVKKKKTSPLEIIREETVKHHKKFSSEYFKKSDKLLAEFSSQLFSLSTFNLIFIASLFILLKDDLNVLFIFLPVKFWIFIGVISGFVSIVVGMLSLWLEFKEYRDLGWHHFKESYEVKDEKDRVTLRFLKRRAFFDLINSIRVAQKVLFLVSVTSAALLAVGALVLY